jgi:DNA-binding NtrC family response regulator
MGTYRLLIVDDQAEFRTNVRTVLEGAYHITEAASEQEFRQVYRAGGFDLVLLDMRLETGREGLRLLREILAEDELQPVIMVSAYGDTEAVLASAESGALMFLHKQEFTPNLLARMVEAVLRQGRLRRQIAAMRGRVPAHEMMGGIGLGAAGRRVAELVRRAAEDQRATVLVSGEPGARPELVAEAIYDRGRGRTGEPLVLADARAANWSIDRSALFGSAAQAGAGRRRGLLELAQGGVLFLGHMDSLDPCLWADIGRALAAGRIPPGGAPPGIPVDVQLVAGMSPAAVAEVIEALGELAGPDRLIEINLPPLRERREDIALLATHILHEMWHAGRTSARTLARDALEALEQHPWPGNLAELQATVEFAAVQATIGEAAEELTVAHIPSTVRLSGPGSAAVDRWNYRFQTARAEVELVEMAARELRHPTKAILAERLGYTDRFALGRRVRKALADFPELAADHPRVAALFRDTARSRRERSG